ncbi:hypothetical protein R69888_06843 [Paraburkholderia haematera]|uniref:TIR domain-containing protein n=2 Tax=Paraburkholderia haematera TaxID=2793077 RepID=A0ABN7MY12_9BURK|nr:hypothetical protein R69888_06843 [Paraburkholderia haematera]
MLHGLNILCRSDALYISRRCNFPDSAFKLALQRQSIWALVEVQRSSSLVKNAHCVENRRKIGMSRFGRSGSRTERSISIMQGTRHMTEICLIYARASESIVRKLHGILATTRAVWWDQDIHSGNYRTEIEKQLMHAKCVIPIWCKASRKNSNVLDEAKFAEHNGVPLLPVAIENVVPPLGFGNLHTVSLSSWDGNPDHPGITELLRNIDALLGRTSKSLPLPEAIDIGGRSLALPTFFRSVSSHETQLRPAEAVKALGLMKTDALLVSAYDMAHESDSDAIESELSVMQATGSVVLLDSGNYEASRKGDGLWTAEAFHRTLTATPYDIAFCFDQLEPPNDVDGAAETVIKACERDAKFSGKPILPIVHAPKDDTGRYGVDLLPAIIARVSKALKPSIIAVPERELGDGLIQRAQTVVQIRRGLDALGFYQPLHLLGTGNPLSIAVLAAAGANFFDGLEWCRTVADSGSGHLYHFQQYDFFAWQTAYSSSPFVQEAARSADVEYAGKVVFHNLDFFASWMHDVTQMVRSKRIDRFLSDKMPGGRSSLDQLEKAIPSIF